MTLIPLKDLKPNPHRDFDYYPIDHDQVGALTRSIKEHGFFGGVKARPNDKGGYETACGHHRIEAARKAGLKEIDIAIGQMDDDEMIRLMCVENATQRGAV